MNKGSKVIGSVHLLMSSLFSVSILSNLFLPQGLIALFVKQNPYGLEIFINTIVAFVAVANYIFLLAIDKRQAWKPLFMIVSILPFLYVLATISDKIAFQLSFKDLLDRQQPLLHRLR